jgi:phage conserved hypothetical protein, C-terminal domain
VINWHLYQRRDSEANQHSNQQLTNNQPTTNQQLTTNKKGKKGKEGKEEKIYNVNAQKIIGYLNEKSGKKFKPTDSNLTPIIARFKDGHTCQDCLTVIDRKCSQWKDTTMDKFLRPSTLFRPSKFEGYLNEKPVTKNRNENNYRSSKAVDPNMTPEERKRRYSKPDDTARLLAEIEEEERREAENAKP